MELSISELSDWSKLIALDEQSKEVIRGLLSETNDEVGHFNGRQIVGVITSASGGDVVLRGAREHSSLSQRVAQVLKVSKVVLVPLSAIITTTGAVLTGILPESKAGSVTLAIGLATAVLDGLSIAIDKCKTSLVELDDSGQQAGADSSHTVEQANRE